MNGWIETRRAWSKTDVIAMRSSPKNESPSATKNWPGCSRLASPSTERPMANFAIDGPDTMLPTLYRYRYIPVFVSPMMHAKPRPLRCLRNKVILIQQRHRSNLQYRQLGRGFPCGTPQHAMSWMRRRLLQVQIRFPSSSLLGVECQLSSVAKHRCCIAMDSAGEILLYTRVQRTPPRQLSSSQGI